MNGILLVNKPCGMTSHDVVNKIRKIYHTKKVGHCGTLDPDATGVLVICLNKATKIIQFLDKDEKEYVATLSLGKSTDTYDASGKVLEEKEVGQINLEEINQALNQYTGDIMQLPPMYSAIKVNGKKLYEYARNGQDVEVKERPVTIKELELLSFKNTDLEMRVLCSKGTYIRSLCVDIAKTLGYPGHMSHLIRTQSGRFTLNQCFNLDEITMDTPLISIDEGLSSLPQIIIDDETIVYHGKKIKSDQKGQYVIYNKAGQALAVYQDDGQGYLKNVRGLW